MRYLGGGIGHRATHQASPAVSSDKLVNETADQEESDGGDLEKGGNGSQDGDLEYEGVGGDIEIEKEEDKGEEGEEGEDDEDNEDKRYDYGYEDEEEDEGEEGDEVMEEVGDDKDDENEIDPLDDEYGEL